MDEKEIRRELQRDEGTEDMRGPNVGAMDNLIGMLEMHQNSTDEYIRSIANNFLELKKIAPNFTIFEVEDPNKCGYMRNFSAFQIAKETEPLISSHEFGHAVIGITSKTQVPVDYENVILRAKEHAKKPENIGKFREYINYLTDSENQNRTKAEKGPVSDIISSIFQYEGFVRASDGKELILPGYHTRDYYFDEKNNSMITKNIYDEDFANFYSLKANNCEKELETLKELFGEELINVLDIQLLKSAVTLQRSASRETGEINFSALDNIKDVITESKKSDLSLIKDPEKVNLNEKEPEDEKEDNEGEK